MNGLSALLLILFFYYRKKYFRSQQFKLIFYLTRVPRTAIVTSREISFLFKVESNRYQHSMLAHLLSNTFDAIVVELIDPMRYFRFFAIYDIAPLSIEYISYQFILFSHTFFPRKNQELLLLFHPISIWITETALYTLALK